MCGHGTNRASPESPEASQTPRSRGRHQSTVSRDAGLREPQQPAHSIARTTRPRTGPRRCGEQQGAQVRAVGDVVPVVSVQGARGGLHGVDMGVRGSRRPPRRSRRRWSPQTAVARMSTRIEFVGFTDVGHWKPTTPSRNTRALGANPASASQAFFT